MDNSLTGKSGITALDSRDWLVITILVISAFAIRLYFHQFYRVISADGIGYVNIANDFINGRGFASSYHFPPFYPILVGLSSLFFKDFELAGRAVSICMGSLVVIPVYLLGREFYGRRAGIIAAILTMSWWSIRSWSGEVMSQATYMAMVLIGIYFLWIAVDRLSTSTAAAAGVFLALAHLTRSEGILVYFALSLIIIIGLAAKQIPARGLLCLIISWGAFWLVFSPYFIYLHKLNGVWQVTGKSRMAIADGLSMYLNRPDIRMDPKFVEIGYIDLFRHYPDYLRHNISVNFRRCWEEMFPFYFWVLSFAGFLSGGWDRGALLKKTYLLATFAPLLFICIFFFIGPEYTQPYLPVLFLWAGMGIVWLEGSLTSLLKVKMQGRTGVEVLVAAVSIAAVVSYAGWQLLRQVPVDRDAPYSFEQDEGRYDDKRIGIRLRSLVPQGAVIMTRSGRIGYYSERAYVMPPQTDFSGILENARQSRVSYLVATLQMLRMRPQLEPLYVPLIYPRKKLLLPPGLELVYMGQEPGGLPYLLYRLK